MAENASGPSRIRSNSHGSSMASDGDERVMGGFGEARRLQQAGPGSGRARKHSTEENQRALCPPMERTNHERGPLLAAGVVIPVRARDATPA